MRVFVLLLFLAYSYFPHFPPYLIVPNREIAISRMLQVHFPASSPHVFELRGGVETEPWHFQRSRRR